MAKKKILTDAEKLVIRNQRYIMLAVASLCRAQPGMGCNRYAEDLTARVRMMERNYEWIAAPSERL